MKFLCLFYFLTLLTADQPKILVSDESLDFGEIKQLEYKTKAISIFNDGSGDLKILGFQTDCACTPVVVGKKNLKPNESTDVSVTFTSNLESGPIEGRFIVLSNDPENKKVEIKIKGSVRPEYIFEPTVLNFGVYGRGDPEKNLVLSIKPDVAKGLNIKSIQCDNPNFKVTCQNKEYQEKEPVRIQVRMDKSMPAGRFKAQLKIQTDNKRIPEWKIPIIGVVKGEIEVFPTICTFGNVKVGETKSCLVDVTKQFSGELRIMNVVIAQEFIKYKVLPMEDKSGYQIKLILTHKAPPGRIDTQIKIVTDPPGEEEFLVRVFGLVF